MIPTELRNTFGDRPWAPLAILVEPDRQFRSEAAGELRRLGCDVYDFSDLESLLGFLPLITGGRRPDFLVVSTDTSATSAAQRAALAQQSVLTDVPVMSYLARDTLDPGALLGRLGGLVRTAVSRRRLKEATRSMTEPPIGRRDAEEGR